MHTCHFMNVRSQIYSFLIFSCFCSLLTFSAFAQDCQHYLFLQKNKTIEMTIYNKKGEPNGKQIYQVSDVTTTGGVTTAHLASEMFDKKGKSIAKANSSIKCNGGVMLIDMKMMLPQQQAEQYGKTEVKADNSFLEYPASLNVGDGLKDGKFTMDMNNNGLPQTITMVSTNRKVEAKESITTDAGTWDCYKISYKCKMSVKTGPIGIPFNLDGTEWYAPGFGVIKTQSKYGGTAITSIK
ncbi:TapB family protein [Flavitalea flava]